MNFAGEFCGDLLGVLRVARRDHVVTLSGENRLDQIAEGVFIFDEKNCLRTVMIVERRCFRGLVLHDLSDARQINLEGAAFSRFAVNPDVTATLFNDSVYRRKSEACAT